MPPRCAPRRRIEAASAQRAVHLLRAARERPIRDHRDAFYAMPLMLSPPPAFASTPTFPAQPFMPFHFHAIFAAIFIFAMPPYAIPLRRHAAAAAPCCLRGTTPQHTEEREPWRHAIDVAATTCLLAMLPAEKSPLKPTCHRRTITFPPK